MSGDSHTLWQCFCWGTLRQFTWGTPSICALNLGQLWPHGCQHKVFHKHFSSQKMVGQIVIWLMWVPFGCPCGHVAKPFGFKTRYCMPCCLSAWQVCRCWLPGQWVVCILTAVQGWLATWCSFHKGIHPTLLVLKTTQFCTVSCMHGQLLIFGWHRLYEFVHHLYCFSCKINAFIAQELSLVWFLHRQVFISLKSYPMSAVSLDFWECAGNVISGILGPVIQERGWEWLDPCKFLSENGFEGKFDSLRD